MNGRDFIKTMIPAFLGLLLSSPAVADVGASPNLIFIYPDQMRMHAMGIWSEPGYSNLLTTVGDPVHTPNLNQLAKEGVLFTQFSSTRPVCSPYRASMMSGMYAGRNGVDQNCFIGRNVGLRHDISTFTDVLADKGYETAYVGKMHWEKNEYLFNSVYTYVGPGGGYTPNNFDTYIPPGAGRHGNKFWFQNLGDNHTDAMSYANKPYLIGGKADGVMHRAYQFTPEQEADIIIDFINNTHGERDTSKPFSMFWAPNPPHSPYSALSNVDTNIYNTYYASKTVAELALRTNFNAATASGNIRYYFANVTSIDEHVGRVLQVLKANGLATNTIVVFTSDHGEMMGSHGLMAKNVFYDEAFLVPFILRYPAKLEPKVEDLMMGPVDLMPTILSMMGFKDSIPLSVQGFDYSQGLLTGDYSQQPKPTSALYRKGSGEAGVRTSHYMYLVEDNGTTTLYNNLSDPYQMTNLALTAIPATDLEFLQRELGYWLKKSEDDWYLSSPKTRADKIIYPAGDDFNMKNSGRTLLFDVPKNKTVYVEARTNLVSGVWERVGTNTSPAYASRQAHEMSTPIDSDQHFYRVTY